MTDEGKHDSDVLLNILPIVRIPRSPLRTSHLLTLKYP